MSWAGFCCLQPQPWLIPWSCPLSLPSLADPAQVHFTTLPNIPKSPVILHCNRPWALADCFQIWLFNKDAEDSVRTLGGLQGTGFFVCFFPLVYDSGYFLMALYTLLLPTRMLLFFYHCLPRKIPSLRLSSKITIIFNLCLNSLFCTRSRGTDFRTSLFHSLVLYPWASGLNSLSLSLLICEMGIITAASLWAVVEMEWDGTYKLPGSVHDPGPLLEVF